MPKIHKKSVHFGAGNIGRGFIAPLLVQSGYHVTFIDIQDSIIDALNKDRQYTVHILDSEDLTRQDSQQIRHVSASKTTEDSTLDFIAEAEIITTSVGAKVLEKIGPTIAEGLLRRHERGRGENDLSVIACENLIGATDNLKEYITTTLKSKGHDDVHLILQNVGFPNCEVDRIVPPFRGLTPLDVGVEGFYEWTVEKGKIRPPNLQVKGMQLQDSLEPFFERKLYTLNCGHAMLAFIGHIKGFKTMDEAIGDVDCKHIAKYALRESGAALIRRHGFNEEEHAEYINRTMERYANPNIKDELARVARNPLHKLSPNERLVGAVNMCREYDLPRKHLIKGIAAAFYFDLQEDEEAVQLVQLVEEKGIEAAIEETTGFKKGSRDHEDVFREYFEMGKFAK